MSTEHDDTTPVPRTARETDAGTGDQPTAPLPRTGPGRTEEPTMVFDTFGSEPDRSRTGGHDTPATEVLGTARASDAGDTRPMSVTGPGTTRTSAFAAAGGGVGAAAGSGPGAGTGGTPGRAPGSVPGIASGSAPGTTPGSAPGSTPGSASGSALRGDAGSSAAGAGASVGSGPAPGGSASTATGTWTDSSSGMPGSTSTLPDRAAAPVVPGLPDREISTSLRVGTVVWGLILAIIGAGVIAVAAGAQFDLELAAIGLLALAGVALVVGSVVTAARRKR